jgi:cytochrome c peroxidase
MQFASHFASIALSLLSAQSVASSIDPTVASTLAPTGAPSRPQEARPEWTDRDQKRAETHSPLPAPPPSTTNRFADDERAARLGRALFFDARLSSNGKLSCASCHDPALGFGDGKQVFEGLGRGERHSPTLWNVAYQRWFFWDGRADSLWAQAVQPLESEIEMGGDRVALARLLLNDATLRATYEELFGPLPDLARWPQHAKPLPTEPTHPHHIAWLSMSDADRLAASRVVANAGKTLEAYERKLVRGDAPFDRFVAGDREALSASAVRGWKLFSGAGNCRSCHGGPNFSDGEFHNIGVPPLNGGAPTDPARYAAVERVQIDPFNSRGEFSDDRKGATALMLETLVQMPQTFGEYRTPTLRNIAVTPPYMHQGQFATLRDVLHFYSTLEGATQVGHHQEQTLRPLQLNDSELADLLAFLESLTGREPDRLWLEPRKP